MRELDIVEEDLALVNLVEEDLALVEEGRCRQTECDVFSRQLCRECSRFVGRRIKVTNGFGALGRPNHSEKTSIRVLQSGDMAGEYGEVLLYFASKPTGKHLKMLSQLPLQGFAYKHCNRYQSRI